MADNKRDVFISYHTKSNKTIVVEIARQLEEKGLSCWYAPRDCDEVWSQIIMEAIKKASIFLVLLNEYSCDSTHVLNEINAATTRYAQKNFGIIVFKTDVKDVTDQVSYYLGRFHFHDGTTPPIENRIEELVARIIYARHKLEDAATLSEECRFLSSTITPFANFVGRKGEKTKMRELLDEYHLLFIKGMGGIGKTALVTDFLDDERKTFRSIWMASYEGDLKKLMLNYCRITNFLRGGDEDDEAFLARKMAFIRDHGTYEDVLVIDNYDVDEDPYFEEVASLPISILITSRRKHDEKYACLEVTPMQNEEDLFALFQKHYPRELSEEERTHVAKIFALLGGHTLAIKAIATSMRMNRIKPEDMEKSLSAKGRLNAYTQKNVDEMIYSLFDFDSLSLEERKILFNLLFVPLEGMYSETLHDYSKLESYEALDNLINRSWVSHNPAKDMVSLHPIMARMVKDKIPFSDALAGDYLESLIDKLNHAKYILSSERYYVNLLLQKGLEMVPPSSSYYIDLRLAAAFALHAFGLYRSILEVYGEIDESHLDVATRARLHSSNADAYRCLRQSDSLYKEASYALSLAEQMEEGEKKDLLRADIYGEFGWYYSFVGDFSSSADYFIKELRIVEKEAVGDHEKIGWAYFNVGIPLRLANRNEEALSYFEKSAELFRLIKQDFAYSHALKNIGIVHFSLGEKERGLEEAIKANEIMKRVVGDSHFDIAMNLHDLARMHKELGNEEKAKECEDASYDICARLDAVSAIKDWMFR